MSMIQDWTVDGINYEVHVPDKPEYNPLTHEAHLIGFPYKDGDLWRVDWVVAPIPEETILYLMESIRGDRNQLLVACDWVVIFHVEKGTSIPVEWKVYRQQLRDITSQEGFPHSVMWPSPPA